MVLDAPGLETLCLRVAVAASGHDLLNYLRHWRSANCLFPQSSVRRQVADRLRKSNGKLTTPAADRQSANTIGNFPHGLSITACAILDEEQRFGPLFDAGQ